MQEILCIALLEKKKHRMFDASLNMSSYVRIFEHTMTNER